MICSVLSCSKTSGGGSADSYSHPLLEQARPTNTSTTTTTAGTTMTTTTDTVIYNPKVTLSRLNSGSFLDPSARSLNGHGISRSDISASFLRVDEDAIEPLSPVQGTGQDALEDECFFPNHQPLQGEFPQKVVKYAHRRLRKAKISTNVLSTGILPILPHSDLELDKLMGEGSFSSVYSIKRLFEVEPNDTTTTTTTTTTTPTTTTTTPTSEQDSPTTAQPRPLLPSKEELVVKVLRKKLLKNPPMLAACAADLIKEGMILDRLSPHENVLQIYAWGGRHAIDSFANGRHDAIFLVLGKLEMTLSVRLSAWRDVARQCRGWTLLQSKRVRQCKMTSLQERLAVIEPLLQAVTYMHSQGILHRDLKPDNLGFDSKGVLKVFDFDVARTLPCISLGSNSSSSSVGSGSGSSHSVNVNATFQMTKRVGSPRYMAPECARGDPYNAKADVYSIALLIHELISLEKPYEDIPSELHDELVFYQGARPFIPPTWPTTVQQGLDHAWSERVSERPTATQLLDQWRSEWYTSVILDKQRKYRNPFGKSPNAKTKKQLEGTDQVAISSDRPIVEKTSGQEMTTPKNNHHKRLFWESSCTSATLHSESNEYPS